MSDQAKAEKSSSHDEGEVQSTEVNEVQNSGDQVNTEVSSTQCAGVIFNDYDSPYLLPAPRRKACISIWNDVKVDDLDLLFSLSDDAYIRASLIRIFYLDDFEENPQSAILADMYFYAFRFARYECCLGKEQVASFLSILKQIHELCVATPYDNFNDCVVFLRELIKCHIVHRPPFSIQLFSLEQAQQITSYITDTYFRHFKLYKYVFTPDVTLDLVFNYPQLPVTPEPCGEEEQGTAEARLEAEGGEDQAETEPEEYSFLRQMVRQHLTAELEKLKLCVEGEIAEQSAPIDEKLNEFEKSGAQAAGKGKKDKKKTKK